MTQRFAPTHGMTPTANGQYILAAHAEDLQRALAESVRTAGEYFDMVERGEVTAAQARAALEVAGQLSMALLTDDSNHSGLAYLIQQEGDWTIRIDSAHGAKSYHKRHVHVRKRGLAGEYSWNEDGTRHDRHRFPASERCIRAAKEKAAKVLRVQVELLQLVVSEHGPLSVSARTGRYDSVRTAPSLDLRVRSSYALVVLGSPSGLILLAMHDASRMATAHR